MLLKEIKTKEDYLKLPQTPENEVRLLWHGDYNDGPKDGLLLYYNAKHWFQTYDEWQEEESDNTWFRNFVILELSKEQLEEEEKWHRLFQQKVGMHTDYDENGQRPLGQLQPEETWNDFYEPYKQREKRDFSNNKVVARFSH